MLAFSTISHVGFILLALAISTEQSIESLIFYIIQYTITNLNTFLIIIALSYIFYESIINKIIIKENFIYNKIINFSDIIYIYEFKGQFIFNPLLSLSLSICLFSMAGIPPLIGFFSKQFVLLSAIQNGYYFMALVAIIVSVISASYYLKIIKTIYTKSNELKILSNNELKFYPLLTNVHSFFISILTLIILLFVLKPSIILSSIRILSISIFYL